MKKLFTLLFIFLSFSIFAQSAAIKKNVTYGDTTLSKAFFTYNWTYDGQTKIISVNIFIYMSKTGMRLGSNQISVPEIPRYIEINTTADQTKQLDQLDTLVKNAVKNKLKEINPTWQNSDFEWY